MKLLVTFVATRYYSIIIQHLLTVNLKTLFAWPCGPMDKASDFESEDCGFDPQFVNNYYHGRIKNGYYIFGQVSVSILRPEEDCRFD